MEVVASLSQGRTAAAQCGFFTYKSVPVILEHLVYKKTTIKRNILTIKKIQREVGRAKDLSEPLYIRFAVCIRYKCHVSVQMT